MAYCTRMVSLCFAVVVVDVCCASGMAVNHHRRGEFSIHYGTDNS